MVINIKKIGIILRKIEENNKKFVGIRLDMFQAFKEFDVITIGIPITNDFKVIKKTIAWCDGIILPGGDNFLENDFLLVKYLYENDIPVLGICLGMQAMALFFNNCQEIKVLNHKSNLKYAHYININKDSLLYKIMKKKTIMVNSRHTSGIINSQLKVNAYSKDGIIEGIEDNTRKFFLGVLWHPESIMDTNSYELFKYFIKSL